MKKDSTIRFRVDKELREQIEILKDCYGFKTISDLFRDMVANRFAVVLIAREEKKRKDRRDAVLSDAVRSAIAVFYK